MENYSTYKLRDVTYSSNILDIMVDNIGVHVDSNSYASIGHVGTYSSVWLRDVPLDEVINLRNKLTEIIDSELLKIKEKLTELQEYNFEYTIDNSKHLSIIKAASMLDAVNQFKKLYPGISYTIVNKTFAL